MWVVDWPMFEWDEDESRWDPLHHPFTAPQGEFDPERPGEALAAAYDIVWNGQEMGGGSIRIADRELQERVFETIGIGPDEARGSVRLPARGAPLRGAARTEGSRTASTASSSVWSEPTRCAT